jgi:peptide/nickel transport system permease protein
VGSNAGQLAAPTIAGQGLAADRWRSSRFTWARRLVGETPILVSLLFLALVALLALLAPVVTSYDPTFIDPVSRIKGPSADHWLGTDDLGRDSFTRLLYGARISLLVGTIVTVTAAVFGSVLGLVAAYFRRFDGPIMRVLDGLMAFPSILLAVAIMASLGPRTINVIAALVVVYVPPIARLVRGAALVVTQQVYVESARAVGVRDATIMTRYVFANSLSPLIVQCTFIVSYAIIAEASLSFLGAGVPPETPTWGNMLRDGQRLINQAWWLSVFPGSALFLTVLALNLVGDALRDALDPRLRR